MLVDHLGNTRATFVDDGGSALLTQSNHYYPFGLEIAALNYTATPGTDYDYLYNGKELQEFNDLNWHDYGARFYDASVGRFFRIDRFAQKYVSLTPYQYAAANPLVFIDINGDSLEVTHRGTTYQYRNGHYYDADGNQVSDDNGHIEGKGSRYFNKVSDALQKLESGGERGAELVANLVGSDKIYTIARYAKDGNGNTVSQNAYLSDSRTIVFDPDDVSGGLNAEGRTLRPSFIGLAHELAHAEQHELGVNFNYGAVTVGDFPIPIGVSEVYATSVENRIRSEHGITPRIAYVHDSNNNSVVSLTSLYAKTMYNLSQDLQTRSRIDYHKLHENVPPYPIPRSLPKPSGIN